LPSYGRSQILEVGLIRFCVTACYNALSEYWQSIQAGQISANAEMYPVANALPQSERDDVTTLVVVPPIRGKFFLAEPKCGRLNADTSSHYDAALELNSHDHTRFCNQFLMATTFALIVVEKSLIYVRVEKLLFISTMSSSKRQGTHISRKSAETSSPLARSPFGGAARASSREVEPSLCTCAPSIVEAR
jgi:hypothetical protein